MTRADDSKRPHEDLARRGGQVRPGRGCTAKSLGPWRPLVPRASGRAHGAPVPPGPNRSTPLSYGCGEGEAKGSNRGVMAADGLVFFLFKMRYLLHDLMPPRPAQYAPPPPHTPSCSLLAPAGASRPRHVLAAPKDADRRALGELWRRRDHRRCPSAPPARAVGRR